MMGRHGLASLAAIASLALAACGTAGVTKIKVPIPVECRVQTPARPAMPTEALAPGVELDRFAASAMAEIEIREGYELELRAAVDSCTAPVAPS